MIKTAILTEDEKLIGKVNFEVSEEIEEDYVTAVAVKEDEDITILDNKGSVVFNRYTHEILYCDGTEEDYSNFLVLYFENTELKSA